MVCVRFDWYISTINNLKAIKMKLTQDQFVDMNVQNAILRLENLRKILEQVKQLKQLKLIIVDDEHVNN